MSTQASLKSASERPNTTGSVAPVVITYKMVIDSYLAKLRKGLKDRGKSTQLVNNSETALKNWLEIEGMERAESDPVGNDFDSGFKNRLEKFIQKLESEELEQSTINSRKTAIRNTRKHYLPLKKTFGLPEGFGEALLYLLTHSNSRKCEIAKSCDIDLTTLNNWSLKGILPGYKSISHIAVLEDYFLLPRNTLRKKLPRVLWGARGKSLKTGGTAYRDNFKEAIKPENQYVLYFDDDHISVLPQNSADAQHLKRLQSEWGMVVRFFTADSAWLRKNNLKRNSQWRVRSDDVCSTSNIKYKALATYYGYLCLPKDKVNDSLEHLTESDKSGNIRTTKRPHQGKGLKLSSITLALLGDTDLVYDYIDWYRKGNQLQAFNSTTKQFLRLCAQLLRPETGFLWQHPEFGQKLSPQIKGKAKWQDWCARNHALINDFDRGFRGEKAYKVTRDTFEIVRPIIESKQHPIDVLEKLAEDIEADMPPTSAGPAERAAHFQNLFLVKFATLMPFRAYNFTIMTYKLVRMMGDDDQPYFIPDPTSNLYQREDKSWWVRFSSHQFKNEEGAARAPYDAPIEESLWPYIEEFLTIHRKHLVGAAGCLCCIRTKECEKCSFREKCSTCGICGKCEAADYVFRLNRRAGRNLRPTVRVVEDTLSDRIWKLTSLYIGNPGFRLHAFRHLAASEYIKNNPGGYAIAAAVLHITEEIVRKHYAWTVPKDKIIFWNKYYSEQRERRQLEKKAAEEAKL